MAKLSKKKSFEFKRVGRASYPWAKWLDGQLYEIEVGVDFTVSLPSFRALAFTTAKAQGYKVNTQMSDDKKTLYLQRGEKLPAPAKETKTKTAPKKTKTTK